MKRYAFHQFIVTLPKTNVNIDTIFMWGRAET